MERIRFKRINVTDVYMTILTEQVVTNEAGWSAMQPVDRNLKPTGSLVFDAVARAWASDCTLSPAELAEAMGLKIRTLCDLFQVFTGLTTQEFHLRYRLRRLGEWLKYTDEPLKAIAQHCGFASVTAMGRHFKLQTQMTLVQYRRKFRPANFRDLYRWQA
ncbi:hypothetical protein B5F77_06550 [Parabacteroides sp. An277]|uniref:helix-turn-helix domain-containing protein n=1 Tax=Parabacteroides sp. An277 TaxID=1965619 RepID=UPI000B39DF55|nr:AraC family transcriptional regulator [Parabacteroides sp. An277]OUO53192.1 hypothetical protein B5F77_06550 [Parabacteroides sp. An277]